MAKEGDWIGNVGHLALADSTLSELLIDMLRMIEYGKLSGTPKEPDPGLTTRQAAKEVRKCLSDFARLFPDEASGWLSEVLDTAEIRNEVLHAVALNRCVTCGTATQFEHPRSGKRIDRSDVAVQELTTELLDLIERGRALASRIGKLVNERIVLASMLLADDTGETVVPELVTPGAVEHSCGECNGNGRASATVTLQGSVEVKPTGVTKALLEGRHTHVE